ncbi:MAG: anthranilate synthase component I [Phycisphaerales bacterium]
MILPDRDSFISKAQPGCRQALVAHFLSDQLTPVLAYRRLVAPDERTAPSFLFESVENGDRVGRFSILGTQPTVEMIAYADKVTLRDHHRDQNASRTFSCDDPLAEVERQMRQRGCSQRAAIITSDACATRLPDAFTGGWVGYASYDTVRYLEAGKLPFLSAPHDDRNLPDLHFGLYETVVIFDHVAKSASIVTHVMLDDGESPGDAWQRGCSAIEAVLQALNTPAPHLRMGNIDIDVAALPTPPGTSNFACREDFETAVLETKEYIAAGDAFQVVLSQRFVRNTTADPFDVYRALRVVNPSPYMIYLQAEGSIMVASSPEILCRVHDGIVTNRPLAGTRMRGSSIEEDAALAQELLADEKERAEHIMLVDLARNDLGRVCDIGSITLDRIMEIERYSHVMHISSTVTGHLRSDATCWDALRATLPVGTVSGAPKVRAMQIIDSLEPTRRGPYGGGIGGVSFSGNMDIALTLRTMIFPIAAFDKQQRWTVHLQAGAGIVADSVPAREYQETVSKAAALGRAIDLAERAFAAG